jgi:trk system potassium uptake protein TrkA
MTERTQHAVVVGCGRVGAGLALRLSDQGYTVAVIDSAPSAFRRLDGLDVERIEGVAYDRDTLLRAGVERAVALAAVTNGDNTNIVVARTARELFQVPRVLARIYDVRRAAIYERLGIPTVASASLTIEMATRWILPDETRIRWVDPSAAVCVVERPVPLQLIGTRLVELEAGSQIRIVAVRRLGTSVLLGPDLVAQEGDVLYAAIRTDLVDELDAHLLAVTHDHGANR